MPQDSTIPDIQDLSKPSQQLYLWEELQDHGGLVVLHDLFTSGQHWGHEKLHYDGAHPQRGRRNLHADGSKSSPLIRLSLI